MHLINLFYNAKNNRKSVNCLGWNSIGNGRPSEDRDLYITGGYSAPPPQEK